MSTKVATKILEYINPGSAMFWTGLGMIGFGCYQLASGNIEGGIRTIGEGFGMIAAKRAIVNAPAAIVGRLLNQR